MTVGGATYNAVDIGSAPYGLIVEKRRVGLLPTSRDRAMLVPGRPGSYDFGADLGERQIEIDGFINQVNNVNLEAAVPAIAALFDPTNDVAGDRGFKQLIFDTLNDRYFLARLAGSPVVERLVSTATVKLRLRCSDPFAYALATAVVTTGAGVASIGVTLGGNYKVQPIIELTAAGAFTGTVTVTHAASGLAVTWTGTLALNDILKFDHTVYRVYLNGAVSMAGAGGTFFPLVMNNGAPVLNTLNVTGIAAGSITQLKVTTRSRWL